MTDKLCNCSTCPHHVILFGEDHHCKKHIFAKHPMWITHEAYEAISTIGCLSHPHAREYLMKDIIKKLEEEAKVEYIPEQEEITSGILIALLIVRGDDEE
jgi:hypothetical protein